VNHSNAQPKVRKVSILNSFYITQLDFDIIRGFGHLASNSINFQTVLCRRASPISPKRTKAPNAAQKRNTNPRLTRGYLAPKHVHKGKDEEIPVHIYPKTEPGGQIAENLNPKKIAMKLRFRTQLIHSKEAFGDQIF
jgi:hypothetical protein